MTGMPSGRPSEPRTDPAAPAPAHGDGPTRPTAPTGRTEARTIPALPTTINDVPVGWERWEPALPLTHIDPNCPTCAYDGGQVLAFGLAGDPPLIRFNAHRCPACDETTVYERVRRKCGPPGVRMREVAYFPPRTKEPDRA